MAILERARRARSLCICSLSVLTSVLTLERERNPGHQISWLCTVSSWWLSHFPYSAQARVTSVLLPREREGGPRPGSGTQLKTLFRTHHFGLERWLDLPVLQFFPVDPPEEGVLSDIPLSLGPAAQPLGGVFGHELERKRRKDSLVTAASRSQHLPWPVLPLGTDGGAAREHTGRSPGNTHVL